MKKIIALAFAFSFVGTISNLMGMQRVLNLSTQEWENVLVINEDKNCKQDTAINLNTGQVVFLNGTYLNDSGNTYTDKYND